MGAPVGSATVDQGTARIIEIVVGDEPAAWVAAGFAVDGDRCRVGTVTLRLAGHAGGRGIRSWTLAGVDVDGTDAVDGVVTHVVRLQPDEEADQPARPAEAAGPVRHEGTDHPAEPAGAKAPARETPRHPNAATGIDHVVLATPDLPRTIDQLESIGLELRRTRAADAVGSPMRQAFFRLGEVVLEVVGPPEPTASGPATWFGLAFSVADLDVLVGAVGPHLGRVKPAVQAGRQITTLRHRDLGLSVAVAFMDEPAVP